MYPNVAGTYVKGVEEGKDGSTPYWLKNDNDNLAVVFKGGGWIIMRIDNDSVIAKSFAKRFGIGNCPSTTPTEWAYIDSTNQNELRGNLVTVSENPGE